MSGTSGPLLTLVVTVCLGGAILYLLNRLRRTDREVRLLNGLARQHISVSDVRTIATKIVQKHQQSSSNVPENLEQLVQTIAESTVRKIQHVEANEKQEQKTGKVAATKRVTFLEEGYKEEEPKRQDQGKVSGGVLSFVHEEETPRSKPAVVVGQQKDLLFK